MKAFQCSSMWKKSENISLKRGKEEFFAWERCGSKLEYLM
jgi:hypothetical protein